MSRSATIPATIGDLAATRARTHSAPTRLCLGPDDNVLSCRAPIAPWARRCSTCTAKRHTRPSLKRHQETHE